MGDFFEGLRAGRPQLGLCVMYPASGIVERIGPDWDWVWVDGQHGELGYQDILAMVRACDLVSRPAFVRVPWLDAGRIGLALDAGATGVIVPCVDTPEQAKAAADAAKFPPLGRRSYGGRRMVDRKGRNYSDSANRDTMLVVQVETPEALSNLDAIAAVPGVDALFLGPDDLLLRRGVSMTAARNRENLGADMEAVAAACRRHGKASVMIGGGKDLFALCLSVGANMIVGGGDVVFLASASGQAAADARAMVGGAAPRRQGG
jgi:4-hydroxy-2-oxoheptanedioate aldolase